MHIPLAGIKQSLITIATRTNETDDVMSGEQDRLDAAVRQEIAAGRDGYTAGRDMTVIYQHRDNRASALHEKRRGRDRAIIGQLITEITDPHDLEIHPSIDVPDSSAPGSVLPPYIPRTHDRVLRKLVKMAHKRSVMAVLVGGSSTGKTRACWEAICTLPRGWRIWHPVSPTRPEALWTALQDELIGPRTVIWLNETQFYLDIKSGGLGELIAASLRDLIRTPERGPVLILGTLWPEYWELLTRRPSPVAADPHSQARALLETRSIIVPERFERQDLTDLPTEFASDPRIVEATKQTDGRVTQFLAGGFELVNRYQLATPEARALITAAMDARRFTQEVSSEFLRSAAPGYLDNDTWNILGDNWFEEGLEYATKRCLGVPGPLTKVKLRPGQPNSTRITYQLSDYLEEVARAQRKHAIPPQTFWDAAAKFAQTIDDVLELAYSAYSRGRFRCAAELYIHAAKAGHLEALAYLSDHRKRANDFIAAEQLLREAAERGLDEAWISLAEIREETGDTVIAEQLLENAGPNSRALEMRAHLRARAGDIDGYRALLEQAADLGSTDAMKEFAQLLEDSSGDEHRIMELRKKAAKSEKTFKRLRRAVRSLERGELKSAKATEKFVRIASADDATIEEIRGLLLKPKLGEESVSDIVVLGRIEMNRGLVDQAMVRFSKALDAGSMNERGQNFPLEMLAKIMHEAGNKKAARRLLKYGVELDGTVSQSWKLSINTQEP